MCWAAAKFESEMREAGGKLSQTESEDEEKAVEKKPRKYKKKGEKREEAAAPAPARKVAPVLPAPVTIAAPAGGNTDVPIVDMPGRKNCFGLIHVILK